VDAGTGQYVKNMMPQAALDSITKAFDPAAMLGGMNSRGDLKALLSTGTETKNGVQAHHLHADSTTAMPCGAAIPPGASYDIWTAADGGFLVSMQATGLPSTGGGPTGMSIDVTNINDASLKVTPPG